MRSRMILSNEDCCLILKDAAVLSNSRILVSNIRRTEAQVSADQRAVSALRCLMACNISAPSAMACGMAFSLFTLTATA